MLRPALVAVDAGAELSASNTAGRRRSTARHPRVDRAFARLAARGDRVDMEAKES